MTNYTDDHYKSMGYKVGKCPFGQELDETTVEVCDQHSEMNLKYCPDSQVSVTVYKMGKGASDATAMDLVASDQWYHQMAGDNLCYMTNYTDDHYKSMGYKLGKCPFGQELDETTVEVCDQHSEMNLKYCPDSQVSVTVYKMGKGASDATAMNLVASDQWYHQMA